MTHGDLGRHLAQRALPGQSPVPDRLPRRALARGRAEVVRELGRGDTGTGLQRLADPLMQQGPVAPAQLLGRHPPRQGVREPPAIGLVADLRDVDFRDQAGPRRLLKQIDGRGVCQRGRRRQQRGIEPLADQRGDRERLNAPVRQPSQPRPDHVADGLRDLRRRLAEPDHIPVERADLGQVIGHLQQEEGVARGLELKLGDHHRLAFPEWPADRVLQQGGDGVVLEPAQRKAPALDIARQGRQGGRELAPLRPDVAVHGRRQQRRRPPGPHQVLEQEQRRLVRPLQVVENEQHGMPGRDPPDPRVERLEQPEALGLGRRLGRGGRRPDPVRGLGAQPGDLLGQAVQVLPQHRIRAGPRVIIEGLAERLVRGEDVLVPPPVQHQAAVGVHQPRQLGGERRLPDARLSAR